MAFNLGKHAGLRRLNHRIAAIALLLGSQLAQGVTPHVEPPDNNACRSSNLGGLPSVTVSTPGAWWNPERDGTGWQFYYSEDGTHLTVAWFTYDGNGRPVWLLSGNEPIQQRPSGPVWQAPLHRYTWNYAERPPIGERNPAVEVGSVAISFFSDDPLRAALQWQWDEASPTQPAPVECIRDFTRADGGGGAQPLNVNAAYSGAWHENTDPEDGGDEDLYRDGWGINLNIFMLANGSTTSYLETATIATYDDAGNPVWLLGIDSESRAQPRPLLSVLPIDLKYRYSTGYPNGVPNTPCGATGSGACTAQVVQAVGWWESSFSDARYGEGRLSLNACAQNSVTVGCANPRKILPPGTEALLRFDRPANAEEDPIPIRKLTTPNQIIVDRAICTIQSPQTTCSVTLNWSSDPGIVVSPPHAIFDPLVRKVPRQGSGQIVELARGQQGEMQVPLQSGETVRFELVHDQRTGGVHILASTIEVMAVSEPPENPIANVPDQVPSALDPDWIDHDYAAAGLVGQPGVSGGAATYQIPIVIPPGRKGMQPELALTYSSRAGNGVAGMGWSLSGTSSIHRCPQTVEQDGAARAVDFSANDRLCLDGRRLVPVDGSAYGASGAKYRPEIDDFTLVQQTGTLTDANSSFLVRYKSGLTAHFGTTPISCVGQPSCGAGRVRPTGAPAPLAWMQEYVQDPSGNTIVYRYQNFGDGEHLLREVLYTGSGVTPGTRKVELDYQTRPSSGDANDHSSSHLSGTLTRSTQRLARISTWVGAERIRDYELNYGLSTSASTKRSLLRSILECAYESSGAAQCRSEPIEIEWQEGQPSYGLRVGQDLDGLTPVLGGDANDFSLSVRFEPSADFNGDGSRELIWQGPKASDPNQSERRLVSLRADRSEAWSFPLPEELGGLSGPNQANFFNRADFDMDGRADLVTRDSNGLLVLNFWHGPQNAQTFSTAFSQAWTTNVPLPEGIFPNLVHAGDMDGDGWADVVVQESTGSEAFNFGVCPNRLSIYRNPGVRSASSATGFELVLTECLQTGYDGSEKVQRVSDFNGDGIPDIWLSSGFMSDMDRHTTRILFGRLGPGRAYSLESIDFEQLTSGSNNDAWELRRGQFHLWADLNGDGLQDFILARTSGDKGYWSYRLNEGGRLGPRVDTNSDFGIERCASLSRTGKMCKEQWQPWHAALIRAADVDGDGRDEILVPRRFAARVCGRHLPEAQHVAQCNIIMSGNGDTEAALASLGGNPDRCELFHYCPEDPDPANSDPVSTSPQLVLGFDGNRDGSPNLLQQRTVKPMYGRDGEAWDRSSYYMGAIRMGQGGPSPAVVKTTQNTGIIINSNRPWSADDIYGDGHADVPLMVACYGDVLDCGVPVRIPVGQPNAGELTSRQSPRELQGISGPIPLLTRQPLMVEGRGPSLALNPDGKTPQQHDLVERIRDGLGNESVWTYYPLSSKAGRSGGQETPLYSLPEDEASRYTDDRHTYFTSSMPVVSDFASSDGAGGFRSFRYGYGEAMYNQWGRGFQGFRTVIEEDDAAGTRTTTEFHQKFPLTSRVERVVRNALVQPGTAKPFEQTAYEWRCNTGTPSVCVTPASPLSAPVFPFLLEELTERSDAAAAALPGGSAQLITRRTVTNVEWNFSGQGCAGSVGSTPGFDQWGNLRHQIVTIEDLGADAAVDKHCEKTHRSFTPGTSTNLASPTAWWLDKLDSVSVDRRVDYSSSAPLPPGATSPPRSTHTTYTWKDDRTPEYERFQQGVAGQSLETKYVYPTSGGFGLPSSIEVVGSLDDNPGARITQLQYSGDRYFVVGSTNPANHSFSSVIRPRDGLPSRTADENLLLTKYNYDAFGQLKQTEFKDAADLANRHQPQYRALKRCGTAVWCPPSAVLREMVMQEGSPTIVDFLDSLGRSVGSRTRIADGSWSQQLRSYNTRGLLERQSTPHAPTGTSLWTQFSQFDLLGRPGEKLDPRSLEDIGGLNHGDLRSTYTYTGRTAAIQVCGTAVQFPLERCLNLSRTVDSLGRFVRTVDAQSGETRFWYDAAGNPVAIRDANGVHTLAEYNAIAQRTVVRDPNQGTWHFAYNAFGELLSQTDARGVVTTLRYDRLGRMTWREAQIEIDPLRAGAESVLDQFYFDPAGANGLPAGNTRTVSGVLERMESLFYDAYSRLEQRETVQTIGGTLPNRTYVHRWAYDTRYGRPKAEGWPNRIGVRTVYGAYGHPIEARNADASNPEVYWKLDAVDARGQPTQEQLGPFALHSAYAESTGQVLSLEHKHNGIARRRHDYRHDVFGNLTERRLNSWLGSQAPTERFTYDKLHRMTAAIRPAPLNVSVTYGYDAVGNLMSKSDFGSAYLYGNATKTAGGNAGPNAVRQVQLASGSTGTASLSYDANGNLLSRSSAGSLTAKYDHMNLPFEITRLAATSHFAYAADGSRSRQWGVDGTRIYLPGFEDVMHGPTGQETETRAYLGNYAVLSRRPNYTVAVEYLLRDRLGSVDAVGEANGNIVHARGYDAFGKPRDHNWADLAPPRHGSESRRVTQKGFTQHEHLDSVELIHMNGRAFDYNLGRFLSVDPLIQSPLNSQSLNPYSYILNNPMSGTDPTGYRGCAASRIEGVCDALPSDFGGRGSTTRRLSERAAQNNGGDGGQSTKPTQQVDGASTDGSAGLLTANAPVATLGTVHTAQAVATLGRVEVLGTSTKPSPASARAILRARFLFGGGVLFFAIVGDQNQLNTLLGYEQTCQGSCTCEGVSGNQCAATGGDKSGIRGASLPLADTFGTPPTGPDDDDEGDELRYAPIRKHDAGGWGSRMDLDQRTGQDLLNRSILSGKQRYAWRGGRLYEFKADNTGGWHGYPIRGNEAPGSVLRLLRSRGDISQAEYTRLLKGKL